MADEQFSKKDIEEGKKILEQSQDDDGGVSTSDQALAKSIVSLTNKRNIELLSDLPFSDEVKLLTALKVQAEKLHKNNPKESVVGMVVDNYPLYRVSYKRKGRGEVFGIAKAIKEDINQESRLKKMFKFW